jgi:hypothetical protein
MTKLLNGAIVWLTLLSCLPAGRTAAREDDRFFAVPPYDFRETPDARGLLPTESAGFCFAKTADGRAYVIVSFRETVRTRDEIAKALDQLAKGLDLAVGEFDCLPQFLAPTVGGLLEKSGKELIPFVVPDELFGPRPQAPPADVIPPPKTKWPIVEDDEDMLCGNQGCAAKASADGGLRGAGQK